MDDEITPAAPGKRIAFTGIGVLLLVGAAVGSLYLRDMQTGEPAETTHTAPAAAPVETEEVRAMMNILQTQMHTLQNELKAAQTPPPPPIVVTRPEAETPPIEQEENPSAAQPFTPPHPAPETATLMAEIEALKAAQKSQQSMQKIALASLALSQIEMLASDGKAFGANVDTLSSLPDAHATLQVIAQFRENPPPTPTSLRMSLVAARKAEPVPPTGTTGFLDYLSHKIGTLIRVRKVGIEHVGDDTESVLARVEAYVEQGNIALAAQEIAPLDLSDNDKLLRWKQRATKYIQLQQALLALRAQLVSIAAQG